MPPRRRENCQVCDKIAPIYKCPECRVPYCSAPCYQEHKNTSCSGDPKPVPAPSETARNTSTINDQTHGASGIDPTVSSDTAQPLSSLLVSEPASQLRAMPTDSAPLPISGGSSGRGVIDGNAGTGGVDKSASLPLAESARPLRKLSSLKWPYVPDAPSYPDPLTRDDPKPLNLSQYEAIATSPAVRRALASHPRLPSILHSLDQLRGPEREEALQRVLGVAPTQAGFSLAGISSASPANYSSAAASGSVGRGRGAAAVGVNVDEEDMRALRALAEAIESVVRGTGGTADPLGLDWETMGDA